MKTKIIKFLPVIYIVALVAGIFYVRSVLLKKDVIVRPISDEKVEEKIEFLEVALTIVDSRGQRTFITELSSNSTLNDLLDTARKKSFLYYELVEYSDKIEILVDNASPPLGYKWELFDGATPVTNAIRTKKIQKDAGYSLKLTAL